MPIQSTSEGKISLAKGIIFTKIGLANGYILKLWAAPPNRNLAENPPPVRFSRSIFVFLVQPILDLIGKEAVIMRLTK